MTLSGSIVTLRTINVDVKLLPKSGDEVKKDINNLHVELVEWLRRETKSYGGTSTRQ